MKTVILPLYGFEGIYTISNRGKIRKISNGLFLKPRLAGKIGRKKIMTVNLKNAMGKPLQLSLARLVAQHFVKNPNDYICVHHKDNNLYNCNAWNIAWIPNDVVNWLGTQKKGRFVPSGMPKTIGCKELGITHISGLRKRQKAEQNLIDFYETGDEKYLWLIYEEHKTRIRAKVDVIIVDEDARHDVVIDSFLYFIDLAKRYAIYTYTYKKWLDCLELEARRFYQESYKYQKFNGDYDYQTDDSNCQTNS